MTKSFSMQTRILSVTEKNLIEAKNLLMSGEIIGMPTETVYGLGAIATNGQAVRKIFQVKGRPSDNPLIAHVHRDYPIERLVTVEHDYVYKLIESFMPGPLTLVLKSKGVVCEEAVCGGDTLAIRMPLHDGCQRLLKMLDMPVVAPSANLSKHTSPVTAQHVYDDLNGLIPLILDGGKSDGGIESTVLDVTGPVPRILRAGLVTKEMIEKVTGVCEIAQHKEGDKVKSPGVKYRHYRPKCQTALFSRDSIEEAISLYNAYLEQGKIPYVMCSDDLLCCFDGMNILKLGKTPEEIASNLYDNLLKGEKVADIIIAIEMPSEKGVYMGVMNRLRKACG